METLKLLIACILLAIVTNSVSFAQHRRTREQQRNRPPRQGISTPGFRQGYTNRTRPVRQPLTLRHPGRSGRKVRGNSSKRARGNLDRHYVLFRRALSNYSRFTHGSYRRGFDDCALFFSRISLRYDFLDQHLWRYAQRGSPLSPELLSIALRESSQAADSLVQYVEELHSLSDDYESGTLGQKEFEDLVEQKTSQIRSLAKQIREDRALDYLDQRHDVKFVSPKTAQTIPELRLLLTELTTQAFQIQQGIEIYREGDLSRVINVGELQKPSFKSISKNVDRLAKTIKRSANRL